jgi:hypothetical protein
MFVLAHASALSTVFGIVCGLFITRKRLAFVITFCVPVLVILSSLLYSEYFVPYAGGGASMWPIALIVCAIPAVACGWLGCGLVQLVTGARKT